MADLHYRITWLLPRPSGGQLVLFRHRKCMGMTTAVDEIACRSWTMCPLPIVLRLFVADTISSATVCSQYVKTLCMRQKHGKFYYHNYGTTARPTKNWLTRLILWQLAKMMFPGLHYIAKPSQFISWKYCSGTMTTIVPPSNFNDSHT